VIAAQSNDVVRLGSRVKEAEQPQLSAGSHPNVLSIRRRECDEKKRQKDIETRVTIYAWIQYCLRRT
jgi:hypothetical protein